MTYLAALYPRHFYSTKTALSAQNILASHLGEEDTNPMEIVKIRVDDLILHYMVRVGNHDQSIRLIHPLLSQRFR